MFKKLCDNCEFEASEAFLKQVAELQEVAELLCLHNCSPIHTHLHLLLV